MKRVVNTFILAIIGLIFVFDTMAYVLSNDTISEQITGWINQSITNLIVFLAICAVLMVHFIIGKYKD